MPTRFKQLFTKARSAALDCVVIAFIYTNVCFTFPPLSSATFPVCFSSSSLFLLTSALPSYSDIIISYLFWFTHHCLHHRHPTQYQILTVCLLSSRMALLLDFDFIPTDHQCQWHCLCTSQIVRLLCSRLTLHKSFHLLSWTSFSCLFERKRSTSFLRFGLLFLVSLAPAFQITANAIDSPFSFVVHRRCLHPYHFSKVDFRP